MSETREEASPKPPVTGDGEPGSGSFVERPKVYGQRAWRLAQGGISVRMMDAKAARRASIGPNAVTPGRFSRPAREPELRPPEPPSKVSQSDLISVVIPTFDRRAMVQELLSALEQQAWRPLQVIVVDDGSTDGTHEALTARQVQRAGIELIVLRQQNAGPAEARNRGLAEAAGEFIYFIDSDDLVLPEGLATMAAALRESAAPYCVAGVRTVGPGASGGQMAAIFGRIDEKGILGSTWSTHAALYRRSALERAGKFDTTLARGEDTEMGWRIVSSCGRGLVLGECVGLRRIHGEGQLSDDMSPRSLGLSAVRKISCFKRWAIAHDRLGPGVATAAVQLLTIAAVRLQVAGDKDSLEEIRSLGSELIARGARSSLLFRFAAAHWSPEIFRLLMWLLHTGKDLRNGWRALSDRTLLRRGRAGPTQSSAGVWPRGSRLAGRR